MPRKHRRRQSRNQNKPDAYANSGQINAAPIPGVNQHAGPSNLQPLQPNSSQVAQPQGHQPQPGTTILKPPRHRDPQSQPQHQAVATNPPQASSPANQGPQEDTRPPNKPPSTRRRRRPRQPRNWYDAPDCRRLEDIPQTPFPQHLRTTPRVPAPGPEYELQKEKEWEAQMEKEEEEERRNRPPYKYVPTLSVKKWLEDNDDPWTVVAGEAVEDLGRHNQGRLKGLKEAVDGLIGVFEGGKNVKT
ncbi:hypothetical protein ABW19_dt0201701 [Dactylella cylindrospora]|nr:hypothetical protein ABW19_dt0201701 [Dactylella cylindrospora]